MFTAYIVEDDIKIREELALLLERNAYQVRAAETFEHIVSDVLGASPDVVLLDLNLPAVDGLVICRELRESTDIPIIVVTSRDNDLDELMSMNLGADDFITKPYSPQILLARIANVLKRTKRGVATRLYSYRGVEFDPASGGVSSEGKTAELTRNEMRILRMLMEHAETIVLREDLQNELWQSDEFVDDNTLTVNVNRLRATLASIGIDGFLHTRRGMGYVLQETAL
jgi:DNA-binding response OmpR family regulator